MNKTVIEVCYLCGNYKEYGEWKKSTILHRLAIKRIRNGNIPNVEVVDVICEDCRSKDAYNYDI